MSEGEEVKTVEQPKHTPGPWGAVGREVRTATPGQAVPFIVAQTGVYKFHEHLNVRAEADAELIARALNSHEALVASVRRLLAHFEGTEMSDHSAFPGIAATIAEAKVAVAKATTVFPW